MAVGFIMMVHQALSRAEQVARYWATNDCPVVIHVDAKVDKVEHDSFVAQLSDLSNVRFSERVNCEWGRISIVLATQLAAERMLAEFESVEHVFLASGSCLPLRPVSELKEYLNQNKKTDFIESVTTEEVSWTVGGLDHERFTLRFPFSWKNQRRLFDKYVALQRRIGMERTIPDTIEPHMGSQWWCLTRRTLSAILDDPNRQKMDRYFSRVWIPDESYFQTLVRNYATNIESRSLTLSKFDFQGKPHIFYDDHFQLLRRSDCFVARKIWPRAELLYSHFLKPDQKAEGRADPNPGKLDRVFSKAIQQRTKGRAGLIMQSRFPSKQMWNVDKTCEPYTVYEGFADLFDNFETWLEKRTGARVHGHLFNRSAVHFAGRELIYNGCLANSAKLRDYNPQSFLSNLIWSTQGEPQSFMFGPSDAQDVTEHLAADPNARILAISGAWAVPLFHSNLNFARIRKIAARYQRIEALHLKTLQGPNVRAQVDVWNLADFVGDAVPVLQKISASGDLAQKRCLTEIPKMADLSGFGKFIQNLRNQGMNPYLVGDFPIDDRPNGRKTRARPYIVQ
jgi:hypothetical protein